MPAVFTNRDMQVLEAVFKLIYEEKDVVKPKINFVKMAEMTVYKDNHTAHNAFIAFRKKVLSSGFLAELSSANGAEVVQIKQINNKKRAVKAKTKAKSNDKAAAADEAATADDEAAAAATDDGDATMDDEAGAPGPSNSKAKETEPADSAASDTAEVAQPPKKRKYTRKAKTAGTTKRKATEMESASLAPGDATEVAEVTPAPPAKRKYTRKPKAEGAKKAPVTRAKKGTKPIVIEDDNEADDEAPGPSRADKGKMPEYKVVHDKEDEEVMAAIEEGEPVDDLEAADNALFHVEV